MRNALTVLCVIVILFAGSRMLTAHWLMAILFAVIIALNLMLLIGLFGEAGRFRGAFKLLYRLDGLAVSALTVLVMFSAQQGEAVDPYMIVAIVLLVVKAILTRWLMNHGEAVG